MPPTSAPFPLERRIEERLVVALPVELGDGRRGLTRDISVSGIYFEAPASSDGEVDKAVDLVIRLQEPVADVVMRCHGRVVRCDRRGEGFGVAAQIIEARLETQERGRRRPFAMDSIEPRLGG